MKKLLYILLLFPLIVNATNYYVSNTGSDAAAGTSEGAAWQTISKVMSAGIVAGDFVLFKMGDMWREQLTLPSSGTSGNLITYGAYGTGAKPIINAANVMTGWTNAGSNQWYINNPNAVTTRAMVVIDNVIYAEVASLALVNSANEYFIDVSASPDRVYVYSTVDPATLTAEVSNREYCIVTAAGASSRKYIVIDGLEVRYAGRAGIYFEGPGEGVGDALDGGSVVKNCLAYANRLFGIAHYDHYDNVLFEDCEANYNGNGLYSWVADEGTFRRCTTANQIHYESISAFTDGGGVQGYRSNNIIIENCISNDDYDAIHVDCGSWDITFTMRYNKVYNSRFGSPNTPTMGFGSVGAGGHGYIYYNLLFNGASSCIEAYTTMLGPVDIYNNTMYADATHATDGVMYFTNTQNMNIRNNLVIRDYVGGERNFVNFASTQATQDYNCFFSLNAGANPILRNWYNGADYTTLAAWRTATSRDANSIAENPLFVNVASDWSLQATSPCINAGVSVGLTVDILGNPVVGNPDMGAYENGSIPLLGPFLMGRKIVIQ